MEAGLEAVVRLELFEDKYGLYNEKPSSTGEPTGNDGPILTAYAEAFGYAIHRDQLRSYWDSLKGRPVPVERLPGKEFPPPSRDTVLGWFWLGLLSVDELEKNHWRFNPWPLPKKNFFKTFSALWRLRNAHRNGLWENGGEPHLWRYAFAVPYHDRAYMLRAAGKSVPLLYSLAEKFYLLRTPSSESSKRIYWRKYVANKL